MTASSHGKPAWRRLAPAVWALGITSLFMDTASKAIHSILPLFLVQTLGASVTTVGIIEGLAEGLTSITKLGSGLMSDKLRARKSLTIAGYGLAAISKPLFAIATSVPMIIVARFSDRFGKGIRGAPRDALIADITPKEIHGAAYGLRQALDTVGAIAGPLMAMILMTWFSFSHRAVFWAAVVPAIMAVLVLWLGVKEPVEKSLLTEKQWSLRGAFRLPVAFWAVVAVGVGLTLARFGEAFLILRAQNSGLSDAFAPLVLITMNVVYACISYPAGALSDRISPVWLMAGACLALIGADVVLAFGPSLPWIMAGIAVWGLHMGLSQGVLSSLVGLAAPKHVRASAFCVFNLVIGLAMIASSTLAGVLWDRFGASATFITGGAFSILSLIGALVLAPVLRRG